MKNLTHYRAGESNKAETIFKIELLRISGYSKRDIADLLAKKSEFLCTKNLNDLIEEVFSTDFNSLCKSINFCSDTLQDVELFCDEQNTAYSRFIFRGLSVTTKIRSLKFKSFLLHKTGKLISKTFLDSMLDMLEAEALTERPQYKLNYRIARLGNSFYYDLGDNGVVLIDENGWRIIKQDIPIIFRRSPLFKNQVEPQHGGNIDLLFKYINIADDMDKILVISFIVSALVAKVPKPILALSGAQGSAKTTTQKLITEILDPSLSQDSHIRDIRELLQEATQRYILPFDNLSYIREADSDLLCKMVTGTTFSKRRLYTDEESILFTPHNAIILNGINLPINRSDLLSRALIINLPRIDNNTRRDESSLLSNFDKDKPVILGAFFSLLSKAISAYSNIKTTQLPRMADYAHWGCATAKALGLSEDTFIDAYSKNTILQHEESVDSSMLGQVLLGILEKQTQIIDNPTSLLKNIRQHAQNNCQDLRYLPSSPHAMGKELKRIAPSLEALGITIEQQRSKQRQYIIKKNDNSDISKQKTSSSTYRENCDSNYTQISLLNRAKECYNEN